MLSSRSGAAIVGRRPVFASWRAAAGNVTRAAELLGVSRHQVHKLAARHGIDTTAVRTQSRDAGRALGGDRGEG
ncbi:MAG: hypothetical protein HYV63_00690 [Candidatus Schekmanbacteria bacterium]|nr:hypothetical protein [Candidatus Schekmanbacteria bacterium]